MNSEFSIVKMDRTTAQEVLPIFINKGIFSKYDSLRSKEEILEDKKKELGVESLTPEQTREALTRAGKYRTKDHVVRDYGNYAIGFSSNLYSDYKDDNLEGALEKIRLHKLGHKIAVIILSEAYRQGIYDGLVIPKVDLLKYLGYSSVEKQIYQEISDVLFSLRWLNYNIYQFKNKGTKIDKSATGNFIYHLEDDGKNYKISINKYFIGCIEHLLVNDENRTDEEKKELFSRGYYDYPTSFLPSSKNYSTAGYLLGDFLIMDSGNAKLRKPGLKVVAYKVSRFIQACKIEHSRDSKKAKLFLEALKELKIIESISPRLEDLLLMKPSQLLEATVHIAIKNTAKGINDKIKSENE